MSFVFLSCGFPWMSPLFHGPRRKAPGASVELKYNQFASISNLGTLVCSRFPSSCRSRSPKPLSVSIPKAPAGPDPGRFQMFTVRIWSMSVRQLGERCSFLFLHPSLPYPVTASPTAFRPYLWFIRSIARESSRRSLLLSIGSKRMLWQHPGTISERITPDFLNWIPGR